jgi:hypothetical protein
VSLAITGRNGRSAATAALEFPRALASTISIPRAAAVLALGTTLILELQAMAYGYGLRVTSDTPTYLAVLRQAALHPLAPVSPFLAKPGLATSHATPDIEALAVVWRVVSPSPSLVDPVAAYHLLAWWGVVVTLLVAHALFLWVRGLAGSRAAWVSIPVLLSLFGPANVIWAGDLSFHGFLYASYFSQTFAVALLLYALHFVPRASSQEAKWGVTALVALLLLVHPFTGVLFVFLVTCQASAWAWRGDARWKCAPRTVGTAFILGSAWPAYSLSDAMTVNWLQGWAIVALSVAGTFGAAYAGSLVRWLRQQEAAPRMPAEEAPCPPHLVRLAVCGVAAVFLISIWLEWLVTRPITDPLHPSNRLAIYWDDRLIRWPLMLGAGIVGVAGLVWLARVGSRLPLFWFCFCLAVGVAGAAGLSIPLWNRLLLFCQIPLAAGAAIVLTQATGLVRSLVVTGLLLSAAVRLMFLYDAPPTVTYYPQTWLPAAYSLGNQIPVGTPGVVAADPYTSYYIPAATGHPVIELSKSHVGNKSELAAASAGYTLVHRVYVGQRWKQAMRTMWRRGVRYVVVDHRLTLADPTLEQFSNDVDPLWRTDAQREQLGRYFARLNLVGRLIADTPQYAVYRLDAAKLRWQVGP